MKARWGGLLKWCVVATSALAAWSQVPEQTSAPIQSRAQLAADDRGLPTGSSDGLRTTRYRGRELTYEVIDGWAVHDGDIILGRIEEIEAGPGIGGGSAGGVPGPGMRRDISARGSLLWPDGVIPYEIVEDATPEELRNVHGAIAEWNARTAIQFVPRTGERHYIFLRRPDRECSSGVGIGFPMNVQTVGCNSRGIMHELGHAIGLWHEHRRTDRDEYVMHNNLIPTWQTKGAPPGPGPYDYRSIMHYSGWSGIPPGVPVDWGGPEGWLSAGDVAGVNRLYGQPSEATVIATNPPGLEIVVDGRRVRTPATFHWPAGSSHELEAPLWQPSGSWEWQPSGIREVSGPGYGHSRLFGRWNNGGDRVHSFTARPEETWVEASFIRWDGSRRGFYSGPGRFSDDFEGFDATPPALTFFSNLATGQKEPGAQVIRLTNRGDAPERYTVVSGRPWLAALPSEVNLAPGESADIEVRAVVGGLRPDTHQGELRIRPASLDRVESDRLPRIPVWHVVLPGLIPVQLGASGETVEVAVSATEGYVGKDGRTLERGNLVTATNGDIYALSEGQQGIAATLVPRMRSLGLADGAEVTLRQHGEGDWRIGTERIRSGHRLLEAGHEYVLEPLDGRWRVASVAARRVAGLGDGAAEGVPSLEADIFSGDVAVDAEGGVYVADTRYHRVRKIDLDGTVTTLAGTGFAGFNGDGGPATEAKLHLTGGIAVDAQGRVYVCEEERLRRIDADGTIATVADIPRCDGLAVDNAGNAYVGAGGQVLKIDLHGTVATLGGTGEGGFGGDGGPAIEAKLHVTGGIAVDGHGNVLIAETYRVRKVDGAGIITTVAGTGEPGDSGDGGPATEAQLHRLEGIAADGAGNVYVLVKSDTSGGYTYVGSVRKIDRDGIITTLAPRVVVRWGQWRGLATDTEGSLYVADGRSLEKIGDFDLFSGGRGQQIAGAWHRNDREVFSGGSYFHEAMAIDPAGNAYLHKGDEIYKVDSSGTVTVLDREVYDGALVAADQEGSVYMNYGSRLEKIDSTGSRTTLATATEDGSRCGYRVDGWLAEAQLCWLVGVAFDAAGNVYGADPSEAVFKIDAAGNISTVADSQDLQEVGARHPLKVAADASGNVFVLALHHPSIDWNLLKISAGGAVESLARIPSGGRYRRAYRDYDDLDFDGSLAVAGDGQVFLSVDQHAGGAGTRIWRVDPDTGGVAALAGRETPWLDDRSKSVLLAAGPSGNIWVYDGVRLHALQALPFAPRWQSVHLPGGGSVRLTKFEEGGWRLGDEVVQSGYRYMHGQAEHILAHADGRWSVDRLAVPLGAGGCSAEIEVGADGSLLHATTRQPLEDGSLLTAPNFDTYRLAVGPGGIHATLVPQRQRVALDGGETVQVSQSADGTWGVGGMPLDRDGYVFVNGRGYDLERVQGRWRGSAGSRYSLRTVAGTARDAEGIPASEAILFRPGGVAVDAIGNVFVADTGNRLIRKMDIAGLTWTVAGTGMRGSGGDGGPAVRARLDSPGVLALDGTGNLYFVETEMHVVRRIDAGTGVVERYAGTGERGYGGDGGPAREATFDTIRGLAADAMGNVWVADAGNGLVRRIESGTGTVDRLDQRFEYLGGLAVDMAGRLYVAGQLHVGEPSRVIRIDSSTEEVEVLADNLVSAFDVAVDTAGKLAIAFWDPDRRYWSVARFSGPGPAEWVRISNDAPTQIAVDATGDVYVAEDRAGRVIRLDSATGEGTAVLGTGDPTHGWDGGPAESARLAGPRSIAVDNGRNVFFTDSNRVWKLDASGVVTLLAGGGTRNPGQDGVPAAEARLGNPLGLAADAAGRVYIADTNNHRIRRVDPDGTITTVAGTGTCSFYGGPATEAEVCDPWALALDREGNLYFGQYEVRKINPAGIITTLPVSFVHLPMVSLGRITGLAADDAGNLFVKSRRGLLKIDVLTGDTEWVKEFDLAYGDDPEGYVTADRLGNAYVWDALSKRVRLLGTNGAEKVIAGDGRSGFSGDADRATDAAISVRDMAVDRYGAIWIADAASRRIRVLEPRGAR